MEDQVELAFSRLKLPNTFEAHPGGDVSACFRSSNLSEMAEYVRSLRDPELVTAYLYEDAFGPAIAFVLEDEDE